MIRRPFWLAAGAALGAGGTVWAQRRLERLSRRVRPSAMATGLAHVAERTRQGTSDRFRRALDAGRADAQRREDDLWRALTPHDRAAR